MSKLAQQLQGQCQPGFKAYAKGGVVKHTDEKEDKAMIKKMVKPAALTGKMCGGMVKKKK